ncbi:MAG TPA: ribonuclease HII [Candidatus Diapherotrites archaeon]|uniref:Ribonuclease HII n=1 Tax=Candidatus Iainarchaeum sp. TaxID=3101447 RepID=A0A7J4IXY1_9ARCH|nr:ribonuclease HII [Candidatus Diapherotrites archaeon]
MLIAGIDEAGRGPCIGPLVLGVCVIDKKDEEKLVEIGVRDSKLLSVAERERQFPLIKKAVTEFRTIHITAQEIDELMPRRSLNEIEAMYAGRLLNGLETRPNVVYVDSPDVVMGEFAVRISKYVAFPVKIISEHKADVNYPIVSASSIIAKVERDAEIKKISEEFGNVGSGYPHDEITIRFLKNYLANHTIMPRFVRQSWQTINALQEEKFQKKLF